MLNWKAVRSFDDLNEFSIAFQNLPLKEQQTINDEMLEMLAELKTKYTPYQREVIAEEIMGLKKRKTRRPRRSR